MKPPLSDLITDIICVIALFTGLWTVFMLAYGAGL